MSSDSILDEPLYTGVEGLCNNIFSPRVKARRKDAPKVKVFQPLGAGPHVHEDTEKNLVIATFQYPGISKDEVQLNVQNGNLTIFTESKKFDPGNPYGPGSSSLYIQLPQGVQDEQIKATMQNGVLTLTFPKSLPEVAPKKITILE